MCFEAVHSSLNRPRRHPKRHACPLANASQCLIIYSYRLLSLFLSTIL
ncbi:hypothetical protein [Pseudomonas sp. FEN]|nr:hypothetical protein [Pseudomonas sp. FEN]